MNQGLKLIVFFVAWWLLFLLSVTVVAVAFSLAGAEGGVGPVELIVFGVPTGILAYYLTYKRHYSSRDARN